MNTMHSSSRRRTFLVICVTTSLLHPAGVRAQAAPDPAACTYAACALRVKPPTFTAPPALVRGAADSEVVQLGLFKPAITPHFAMSDSARVHALEYDRLYDRGGVLSGAGAVLAVVAPLVFEGTFRRILFTAVGAGLSVYGGVVTNEADDALSRAVWWYNHDLAGRR